MMQADPTPVDQQDSSRAAPSLSESQDPTLTADECGVLVDHATVHRWSLKMLPVLARLFRRRKHPVGCSWRLDETYVRVGGQWKYLYRAVERLGQTVDFLLTARRDVAAARRFFERAICQHDVPAKITIDKRVATLSERSRVVLTPCVASWNSCRLRRRFCCTAMSVSSRRLTRRKHTSSIDCKGQTRLANGEALAALVATLQNRSYGSDVGA
jgi:transposase-like protein